jgi:hypothetical protein
MDKMKENEQQTGTMGMSVGDELLKAMIDKIDKNTAAIKETNAQLKMLTVQIEALQAMPKQVAEMEALVGETKKSIDTLSAKPEIPEEKIELLRTDLHRHIEYFEKPVKKEIHYKHFVGRPVVVIFILVGIVAGLISWLVVSRERADRYVANDLKFRNVKLFKDAGMLRLLQEVDSGYEANPDEFRKDVQAEEDRRARLAEKMLEANEKVLVIEFFKKQEKRR